MKGSGEIVSNTVKMVILLCAQPSGFGFQYFELISIAKHYHTLNLPINIKKIFKKNKINKIVYFAKKDKKNLNGKINLILLKKIGKASKPNEFPITVGEFKKFLVSRWK